MTWLLAPLLIAATWHVEQCQGTVFGYPGDRLAGGRALWLRRRVRPGDVGIAHRSLELGSSVLVLNERTRRAIVVRVIDRGPYGATVDGQWINYAPRYRTQHRLTRKAGRGRIRYRGCVDLTPRAAKLLGHNGRERVVLFWRR